MQHGCYEIKKVLPVDGELSIEVGNNLLSSDDVCLGIADEDGDIISFVLKEDLDKVLKFCIDQYSIDVIATLAGNIDIDINNINESKLRKAFQPGLNRGVFVGKNKREVKNLIICKDQCIVTKDKYLPDEYEKILTYRIKEILELCSKAADKISVPIFLIGGVVRDLIIGKKSCDIDITVEGNAIEFSRHLKKEYPEICTIKEVHEEFKTVKVVFNIDNKDIEFDIASTRKESYPYPASLPKVDEIGCSIRDDISRRDFTINSMALSLNKASFCKLIDPLNGYDDLKKEKIEILHPVSFVDDPTRIIRALKFSVRFGYSVEKSTKYLAKNCINSGLFDNLGGERIKSEIRQTFNLNKAECLERFIKEKLYFLIDKCISIPHKYKELSEKTEKTITKYMNFLSSPDLIWLIYLGALLKNSTGDDVRKVSEKLYFSGLETEILLSGKLLCKETEAIKSAQTRFEIYEIFEGYFPESILISLICSQDKDAEKKINLYLKQLQDIKIHTTGKTLIDMGLSPGPIFGEILREILKAKINQDIKTLDEEEEFVEKFVSQKRIK